MPKADAHTTTRPSSDITLTNFALALGELEPPRKDDDLAAARFGRLRFLGGAGRFLPIWPAADAAPALFPTDLLVNEFSEKEREEAIGSANGILVQAVRSSMPGHDAKPFRSCWQPHAMPFKPLSETAE